MNGKGKKRKLNNGGSALVSVLVVTVFISIIATTMLYVSAQNYQIKQTDYQNKQSFYGAEEALDNLKVILVKDVETAYRTAYEDTMNNFLKVKELGKSRKEYYQNAYIEALQKIWDDRQAVAADNVEMVRNLMVAEGLDAELAKRIYKVESYGVSTVAEADGTTKKQFVIKGIRAKYTSGNYTTFIYTDIGIALPSIDLSTEAFTSSAEPYVERETIALTDYVIYMNWRKADYDET